MAEEKELIGLSCNHLGGSEDTRWIIEIDLGLRGEETRTMMMVEAYGQDMYRATNFKGFYILLTIP